MKGVLSVAIKLQNITMADLLYSGEGGYKDSDEAVDYWYASAKGGISACCIYKVGEIFELGLDGSSKIRESL